MKDTAIIKIDAENIDDNAIERCVKILREGGTVAFPTETVYGLGADGLNPKAVEKIFAAKGRPPDNPLIIHISRVEDVLTLTEEVPQKAHRVMEEFWPGPLTLIFKKSDIVPCETSGGLSTVAIRMPNHPVAMRLIEKLGTPIAAPSANISGKLSPTRAEHVVEDLTGRTDAIIVSGDCDIGIESTILDMTGEVPVILRPGGVTQKMLERVLGEVLMRTSAINLAGDKKGSESPSMKYAHYSPDAEMIIVQGNPDNTVAKIRELKLNYRDKGKKIGIICTDETGNKYGENAGKTVVKSLGSRKHPETIAANLFKILREFDKMDIEIILCESVDSAEIGQAVMDRLKKAAKGRVIKV